MSSSDTWVRFEGYEGRFDPDYRGAYSTGGFRLPFIEATRTWDIVRVDGEPIELSYSRNQFTVLSRGYDMMGKAHADLSAYRRHFKTCPGVGVCLDIGHPGGPRRSTAQALGDQVTQPAPNRRPPAPPHPIGDALAPPAASDRSHAPMSDWIVALHPVGAVKLRVLADRVAVPVVPLSFTLWIGPPLGMEEDCNKRGGRVVGDSGELSCAEVEIVKRLRNAGWGAAWVSQFRCGERRWGKYRSMAGELPKPVRDLERRIGMGQPGRPDVVAWAGDRIVYVESKSARDRVKPTADRLVSWRLRCRCPGRRHRDCRVAPGNIGRLGSSSLRLLVARREEGSIIRVVREPDVGPVSR